ncbi:MAG: hypothetical protein WCK39_09880, partial [Methanomassiliicoccales archaeon]
PMTSKVRINMNLCDKITTVEVVQNEAGNFLVKVNTPCDNVREFAHGLEELSMADITDKNEGRVFQKMRSCRMSANCLVPAGVISCAWLEAGMIAKSNAKKNKNNNVEFLID